MLIDTEPILPAVCLFPTEKNTRFEVLWPQLRSLKQQHPPPNLPTPNIELLAQQEIMFVRRQWWLQKVLFYAQFTKSTHLQLTEQLEQQMQPHLEQLIKDLVCCSLDVNILVQSDVAERKLFNRAVEAIGYYCLV